MGMGTVSLKAFLLLSIFIICFSHHVGSYLLMVLCVRTRVLCVCVCARGGYLKQTSSAHANDLSNAGET